jgi:hypothetical protein
MRPQLTKNEPRRWATQGNAMHAIHEVNLLSILETDRPGVTRALEIALAALQDGNTVSAEVLSGKFIEAFAQQSPWVTAGDRGIRG